LLNDDRTRRWMRWAMASFYFGAGVIHLQSPDGFLPIMPDWVRAPREVILFTSVCEIAGAFGLVTRSFRWWAAVMLAVYAACVFLPTSSTTARPPSTAVCEDYRHAADRSQPQLN
jgi:uncharacterized membrane protein